VRLFAVCPSCNRRIEIASNARVRPELPLFFQVPCPNPACPSGGIPVVCVSRSVVAESGHGGAVGVGTASAALGGLMAGPLGLGIGLIVGAILGSKADGAAEDVTRFNQS
jgi:hypothetical protein